MIIERFAVCPDPTCCFMVPEKDLATYRNENGHADTEGKTCSRYLYTSSNGKPKPLKILAFTPPSKVIRTFLREPEFTKRIQEWRGPDDALNSHAPDSREPDGSTVPGLKYFTCVSHGSEWRARNVHSKRWITDSTVEERPSGRPLRLVSLRYGLQLVMNLDW